MTSNQEFPQSAQGWNMDNTRIWLLKLLRQHKESSPSDPYRFLDFTVMGSVTEPSGELLREAYKWLVANPFESGTHYIMPGPTVADDDGNLCGARTRISDVGEQLLRKKIAGEES